MKLLAVETATEACSAALFIDGEVFERYQLAPREHTRLILPMVDFLLAEAGFGPMQLDAVAFGCGPGSFTGVRIACGVIHGIAYGADLPVVPVSTLAAMAQDCMEKQHAETVYAALDARMGEIYWGSYQRGEKGYAQLSGEEIVAAAGSVTGLMQVGVGAGSGWKVYHQILKNRLQGYVETVDVDCLPRAAAVARLGAWGYIENRAVPVEQAMPVYLRNKVAKKESER